MEKVHVDWLLGELKVLVEKGVVSSEVSAKISDYYKNADKSVYDIPKEKDKKSAAKIPTITTEQIPVILSVMACILIAAGVISLIAYNWNAIPRFAKAVAAFVMLLAVQALGFIAMFKKDFLLKRHWKEGVCVLWSFLFGGVVAFISQICRLPGNTSTFFFVWSISSILITYALSSTATFFFALAQAVAYAFAYSASGGGAFAFYILFAALIPFARTKKYGMTLMLCVAAWMLGLVLEKGIPGLWIVCSVSFATLCLEYADAVGSKFIKRLSFAGLCILLLILSVDDFWAGIGWKFMRQGYNLIGLIMDCALAFGLTVASVAIPLVPILKRQKKLSYEIIYPLCSLAVAVLYIIYSFMPLQLQTSSMLAPTSIVYLFAILFFVHALHSKILFCAVLLACFIASLFFAEFSNLVCAAAVMILLLEGLLQYRVVKSTSDKNKSAFCYLGVRLFTFIALVLLANNTSWLSFTREASGIQADIAMTSSHFVLYALCAWGGLYLIKKSGFVKRSLDLIWASLAFLLLFIVNAFFEGTSHAANAQTICFVLFCIEFVSCIYDFFFWQNQKGSAFLDEISFWLSFTAILVYYFCSNLNFNYPVVTASSFILLLEALGRYRKRENESLRNEVFFLVRLLAVALFIAIEFMKEDGILNYVVEPKSATFQLAIYAIYTAVAAVIFVLFKKLKQSLDVIVFIAAILLLELLGTRLFPKPFENPFFVVLYSAISLCASSYGIYKIMQWKKSSAKVIQNLVNMPYLLLLAVNQFYTQTGLFSSGTFIILSVPICALVYYYSSEKFSSIQRLSQIAFASIFFLAAFMPITSCAHPSFEGTNVSVKNIHIIFCILHTLLYTFLVFLPVANKIIKKEKCNYIIAFYTLAVFILILTCQAIPLAGFTADSKAIGQITMLVSFITVLFNAGYYIALAYRTENLALANTAGGVACIAIIIKFFSDEYSFVTKGVVFIGLGIVMLMLNMFLLRQNKMHKQMEEEK